MEVEVKVRGNNEHLLVMITPESPQLSKGGQDIYAIGEGELRRYVDQTSYIDVNHDGKVYVVTSILAHDIKDAIVKNMGGVNDIDSLIDEVIRSHLEDLKGEIEGLRRKVRLVEYQQTYTL